MTSSDWTSAEASRIIEMAWKDRTPFEAIHALYDLNEPAVIQLMRAQLKLGSFRLWRKRVSGRKTKHGALRDPGVILGYCPTQYER
jgi:uncharacterized protein (TIGR03643 family)